MPKKRPERCALTLDPYHSREARNYENPIPSREFIMQTLEDVGKPLQFDEIAEALDLSLEDQLEGLRRRLGAMQRDGQLLCNRRGGYCRVNRKDLIAGRVLAHRDGFGFLQPEEGGNDLFISAREMRSLFHYDRILARVAGVDRSGRREAAVVEILERNTHKLVGRIHIEAGVGVVTPDNKRLHQDVLVPPEQFNGAANGQMVAVAIVEQPTKYSKAIGRVTEVLGDHMAPGMEIDVAMRSYGIPDEWPDEVLEEIKAFSEQVPEAAKQGREDLRGLNLVTIDGEDARDFDDAVYCEKTEKGWRMLVCIADVSAYVQPNSALDQEATKRGNSVYFPDRVIPMLPEVLSNGLCSLNPQVDRLCMACEMQFNAEGKIIRSRFFEAVMHSQARLTYTQVAAMLEENDAKLRQQYAQVLPHLHDLYDLFRVLEWARRVRGAIDFDTLETRFLFNAEQKVEQVVPVQRNVAHRIIEECMLAANVAAARLFQRKKLPMLYRVHDLPKEEKVEGLREFLGELGLSLPGKKKPRAADYAALLEQVKGRPDFHLIQTVMLRSLNQAVYSADNKGHFGLSYPAYTHFTSPIRRYPDLLVHRGIKHLLDGGSTEDFRYPLSALQHLGEQCSMTERRADDATRDVVDWLKCEYMLDKVGNSYSGIITGVNSFGLFIDLDEIHVTGLLHVTALDRDYYHFDPIGHRLTGERSGEVFRLGDPIDIQVAAVNLDDRKIDFVLPGGEAKRKSQPQSKSRKSKGEQPASPAAEDKPKGRKRSRKRK
ncbi:MAG: ribonuclease R [Gammaproteobacteria bacterium SHHR-1]|uniref:ribonuclease R n=1 Tax=Magnetovirga frankeli TaxID=947516 RepID=UPI001293700C|nr:ribonuclease R [gamma proteobacterium SS-5]